jgi:pimeloyl-ACP methyl ester carboxylesterase
MNIARPNNVDSVILPGAEREAKRAQANRDELTERIAQAICQDGTIEPLKGLHFNRVSKPVEPCHNVSIPAFCVIAQGNKEILLGNDRYRYDSMHYLLATAELPIVSQILEASPAQPYLSLRLDFDPALIGSVMVEAGYPALQSRANVKAIDVSSLDASLLDIDQSVFDAMITALEHDRPQYLTASAPSFFGAELPTVSISPELMQWGIELALQASPKATIEMVRAFFKTDFRPDMSAFTIPTLIIHGDQDQNHPLSITGQKTLQAIPNSQFKIYEGAARGLFVTHKEQLNNDLLVFIQSESINVNRINHSIVK